MDNKFTLNLSGVDKFAKVLIFKVTFILKWIVPSQVRWFQSKMKFAVFNEIRFIFISWWLSGSNTVRKKISQESITVSPTI